MKVEVTDTHEFVARELVPSGHRSPRSIGLVGDIHASVGVAMRAIRRLASASITEIHFLGDFGLLWSGGSTEDLLLDMVSTCLTENNATAFITGGNHEGYDEWEKVPSDEHGVRNARANIRLLPRGWRSTSPNGNVIASFGGANSIDQPARMRAKSGYWAAEQITESDLLALGDTPVDLLLGHDAPMATELMQLLETRVDRWEPEGLEYAGRGHAMFQRAVAQVHPKLTVSGHYHFHLDVTETFTDSHGIEFESRVVILNADGHPPTLAIVDTDALTIEYPVF